MKTLFAVLCICTSFSLLSQSGTITILDFESEEHSTNALIFGDDIHNGMHDLSVFNPQPDAVNDSRRVLQYFRSSDASDASGFMMTITDTLIEMEEYQFCFDLWVSEKGEFSLQLMDRYENMVSDVMLANASPGQWETICTMVEVDQSGASQDEIYYGMIKQISIVPVMQDPTDNNITQQFYFDNLRVNFGETLHRVPFRINMNNHPEPFTQVYVSGNFNGWSGRSTPMRDTDADGIWELDMMLFSGPIEYLYTLDNWSGKETFSGTEVCIVSHPDGEGGYYRNRLHQVGEDFPPSNACYSSCYACNAAMQLTWHLNMSGETVSEDGVYIAGGAFGHGQYEMHDPDGDEVYSITMERQKGFTTNYTFINGLCPVGWPCKEDLEGQECADETHWNDRWLEPTYSDRRFDLCFGYCSLAGVCEEANYYDVTFRLDTYGMDDLGQIYISGMTINNWAAHTKPMSDNDGDGIYEITLRLPEGLHEYKYVNGNYWETLDEGEPCTITDPGSIYTKRYVEVYGEDLVLDAVLWESCEGAVASSNVFTQDETSIEVFPTLTDSYINVDLQSMTETVAVQIYDRMGQLVSESSYRGGMIHQIEVYNLASGMYVASVVVDDNISSTRFYKN